MLRQVHRVVGNASRRVGQEIPEEFFQAVAQLLALVYRMAGRRAG